MRPEQIKTAMKDPEHLKRWLEKSGRRYLVLDALEFVDSMRWPEQVQTFVDLLAQYAQHRLEKPSGRLVAIERPEGGEAQVPVMRREVLELEELDRAIRYLIGLANAEAKRRGINWDIENPPL